MNSKLIKLINSYPRTRPELPEKQKEIYEKEYLINRNGSSFLTSLSMKLENWMHKKIAAYPSYIGKSHKILEIGAGTLNHIKFEKHFSEYDIIEPFKTLYNNSAKLDYINTIYNDISEIPHEKKI